MKGVIALLFIVLGLFQFFYYGANIFTVVILLLLSVFSGLLAGPRERRGRNSDNLASLAQIDRNRYFRK